jgi:serine/threonine protein kinase
LGTDSEAINTDTSATATAISVEEDSEEEDYDLNYFLKVPSSRKKSFRKDSAVNAALSQVKQHDITEPTKTSYLYYSMELCKGDTLKHQLIPYILTKEQTCEILRQITVGIAYIHEKKLVSSQIICHKGSKIFDIFI